MKKTETQQIQPKRPLQVSFFSHPLQADPIFDCAVGWSQVNLESQMELLIKTYISAGMVHAISSVYLGS